MAPFCYLSVPKHSHIYKLSHTTLPFTVNGRVTLALPPKACHPAEDFFRQLAFSEVWSLLPTRKYLGSQHLLQLEGFQVGKSFHQLSCVLGDGGVLPQK